MKYKLKIDSLYFPNTSSIMFNPMVNKGDEVIKIAFYPNTSMAIFIGKDSARQLRDLLNEFINN